MNKYQKQILKIMTDYLESKKLNDITVDIDYAPHYYLQPVVYIIRSKKAYNGWYNCRYITINNRPGNYTADYYLKEVNDAIRHVICKDWLDDKNDKDYIE